MQPTHAPLRDDRRHAACAAPVLWVLASLFLLQWGLAVGPTGASEASASTRLAGHGWSASRLRDLVKLAGTDLRAKDGKQQAAPSGGEPALAAVAGPVLMTDAGRRAVVQAVAAVPGGLAGHAFQARAPPRLLA